MMKKSLYLLKIISWLRSSYDIILYSLASSYNTNHPISHFPLCSSLFRTRCFSLSIVSTNQRAWSSGHDATVPQRGPTDRTANSLSVNFVACVASARASRPFPCVSRHGYTPADLSNCLLIFISGWLTLQSEFIVCEDQATEDLRLNKCRHRIPSLFLVFSQFFKQSRVPERALNSLN